jgi:hypothetical protein
MANRQPGHHTFGLRTAEQIVDVYTMTGGWDYIAERYQTVYNTTYKSRQTSPSDYNFVGFGNPAIFLTGNQVILGSLNLGVTTGYPTYTGLVVSPFHPGTGGTGIYSPYVKNAKASGDAERMIGVIVGGTGPTTANQIRSLVTVQYSGSAPVLMAIGESSNSRGKFLQLSTGVSGTAIQNNSAGVGQFGICETGGYASGMTGLTGLTGNYVTAFIRPVETR